MKWPLSDRVDGSDSAGTIRTLKPPPVRLTVIAQTEGVTAAKGHTSAHRSTVKVTLQYLRLIYSTDNYCTD